MYLTYCKQDCIYYVFDMKVSSYSLYATIILYTKYYMKHTLFLFITQLFIVVTVGTLVVHVSSGQKTYAHTGQIKVLIPSVSVQETLIPSIPVATITSSVHSMHPVVASALEPVSDTSIYTLLNSYRESKGIAELHENSLLVASSLAKAQDMVASNYFAHTSPSGVSWYTFVIHAGYHYSATAENLAIGFSNPEFLCRHGKILLCIMRICSIQFIRTWG